MAGGDRKKKLKREKKAPVVFRSLASAYRPPRLVPTGIVALDAALGGGILVGKFVEIFGPSKGGKTSLAYEIVRAFQQAGGPLRSKGDRRGHWTVVGEHFDMAVFERVGGDAALLDYEEHGDLVEDYVDAMDRWLADHAAVKLPKVLGLDSIAMLRTRAEAKAGMDSSYDDRAKMIYRALRNLAGPLSRTGTTLVGINQVRQRRLAPGDFRSPEVTPGGWGPEFYASQRLRLAQGTLKRGKRALIREGGRVEGRVVGHRIQCRVDKNRMMPNENVAVELAWHFLTGFDPTAGVFRLLADFGLLVEKTAGSEDGKEMFELNGRKVTDEEAFVDQHPELIREVYRAYRPEKVSRA